jgi:hypothetical protein
LREFLDVGVGIAGYEALTVIRYQVVAQQSSGIQEGQGIAHRTLSFETIMVDMTPADPGDV